MDIIIQNFSSYQRVLINTPGYLIITAFFMTCSKWRISFFLWGNTSVFLLSYNKGNKPVIVFVKENILSYHQDQEFKNVWPFLLTFRAHQTSVCKTLEKNSLKNKDILTPAITTVLICVVLEDNYWIGTHHSCLVLVKCLTE